MSTITANNTVQIIENLRQNAENMKNDDLKVFDDFPVGTVSTQGDLILVSISKLPASAKPTKNMQLAIGNTQGSRHILTSGQPYNCDPQEVIKLIHQAIPEAPLVGESYIGPVFTGPDAYLSHPEHGDQQWNDDSICAVVYQRSLDADEREARVRD